MRKRELKKSIKKLKEYLKKETPSTNTSKVEPKPDDNLPNDKCSRTTN